MNGPSSYYVALGDSMTIDHYANVDAWTRWRIEHRALGAASLLYKNDPLWPDAKGRDLHTLHPNLGFKNCARDGAVMDSVLYSQLPSLQGLDVSLVTLTVGGNDLLYAIRAKKPLAPAVQQLKRQLEDLIGVVRQTLPKARLLLTTIYDPSDATGQLPGYGERLPVELLEQINHVIRTAAGKVPGTRLADVHAHFLGHGITAPEDERWYWKSNIIEPAARGAHEIRRVWWDAIHLPSQSR